MKHVRRNSDMYVPRCSPKAIRNIWVVVVFLLEVGIFIAASAHCHWPDPPGVRLAFAFAPPLLSYMFTELTSILSVDREMARRLTSSSSRIRRF